MDAMALRSEFETLTGDILSLSARLSLPMDAESRRAIARKAQLAVDRRLLIGAALGMSAEGMRVV